jgi:nitrite reductase/ring-hydroxylating ferredoxin subunit
MVVRVGSLSDLRAGERRTVTTSGGQEILVLATGDTIYAISNFCTHRRTRLEYAGKVHTDTLELECMMHAGRFSLVTGEATMRPCSVPIQTFPVVIHDDEVFVRIPDD